MGVVYDPKRVGAGEIPADSNGQTQFDAAIVLGESLAELAAEQPRKNPALLLYMLYGSANKYHGSAANRRSDVDLLVVTDTFVDTSRINQELRDRISGVANAFKVDVNPIVYSRQELESDTKVNPFYAEHLSSVKGVIVHRCLTHFASGWFDGRGDYSAINNALFGQLPFVEAWPFAVEYLKARRAGFQTQLDQAEPNLTALKGPFELPRNLGRTLASMYEKYLTEHDLDAYDPEEDDYTAPYNYYDNDKQKLLSIADATDSLGLIGEDIERLSELDNSYSALLEGAVAGEVSITDYEKWLKSVYVESLERAFKVVSLVDAIVYKTVEKAKLDPFYDTLVVSEYDDDIGQGFIDVRRPASEAGALGALQVVPESYDIDRLIFSIAPRFPELARRYQEAREYKEESRRRDYQNWLKEEAELKARQ